MGPDSQAHENWTVWSLPQLRPHAVSQVRVCQSSTLPPRPVTMSVMMPVTLLANRLTALIFVSFPDLLVEGEILT